MRVEKGSKTEGVMEDAECFVRLGKKKDTGHTNYCASKGQSTDHRTMQVASKTT